MITYYLKPLHLKCYNLDINTFPESLRTQNSSFYKNFLGCPYYLSIPCHKVISNFLFFHNNNPFNFYGNLICNAYTRLIFINLILLSTTNSLCNTISAGIGYSYFYWDIRFDINHTQVVVINKMSLKLWLYWLFLVCNCLFCMYQLSMYKTSIPCYNP